MATPIAGKKASLKVSGTGIALSNEACTLSTDRLKAQITDAAKRVLDPTDTIVLEHSTTGGGGPWTTVPASEYTLNRLFGVFTFLSVQDVGELFRVASGDYLPMSSVAMATAYSLSLSAEWPNHPYLGDDAGNPRREVVVMKDVTGTLNNFTDVDYTVFLDALENDDLIVIEFGDETPDIYARMWARIGSDDIAADVGAIIDNGTSFEGALDDDDRAFSFEQVIS